MVNVHEAKTNFSKLLERAHRGEEIVIAKGGKPYARLVALEPIQPRAPGLLKGSVSDAFFEPLPEEELRAWDGQAEHTAPKNKGSRQSPLKHAGRK